MRKYLVLLLIVAQYQVSAQQRKLPVPLMPIEISSTELHKHLAHEPIATGAAKATGAHDRWYS